MTPTYYVQHPDGSYSVADPQPQQDAQAATCKQCLQVDELLDDMLDTLPYNSPDYWIGRIREVRYGTPTPPAEQDAQEKQS